jgi:hypothetical protein
VSSAEPHLPRRLGSSRLREIPTPSGFRASPRKAQSLPAYRLKERKEITRMEIYTDGGFDHVLFID